MCINERLMREIMMTCRNVYTSLLECAFYAARYLDSDAKIVTCAESEGDDALPVT